MNKEYLTSCIKDLLKHYKDRNFIQMAFVYDEIQMYKGIKPATESIFFTEIIEENKIIVPKALLNKIEYDNEPVLISTSNDEAAIGFDSLYNGATMDDCIVTGDLASPVEIIFIPPNGEITLHDKCVETLNVKQGDIILISAMSEGFYITKFTEKDIKSFL